MPLPLNPNLAATSSPPVMEARRWIAGLSPAQRAALINVSQAAPMAPPPEGLRREIARIALEEDAAHLYGPVLGLEALREALAARFSESYGGRIAPEQVAITSGCNQAFSAALSTLAGPGDEVLLPTPWYFNHKMHLDMAGIRTVPLPTGADLLPDPQTAARLIGPATRAVVLVSPNNPAGVEYPAALIARFAALARRAGIALVLDETYRDFHSRPGAPHDLFADGGWEDVLIQLYSFSKAYRLTGHRVGAMIASAARLREVEKYLDTVTICPNQIAQRAALWGLRNLDDWLAAERREVLARRAALEEGFAPLARAGWALKGLGAYFAWIEHPFAAPAEELAPLLVREAGVLMLPGAMFRPEGAPEAAREFRIAFANADSAGIGRLLARLAALDLSPRRLADAPQGA